MKNELVDWGTLAEDWQTLPVDTSACTAMVQSVRRRARVLLLGVVLELVLLLVVGGLLIFLLQFLPPSSLMVVWAGFGLIISVISVYFRIRNSFGLWKSTAESTRDMLSLSRQRVQAIINSARFNRKLTLVFSVAFPLWTLLVWLREPELLQRNPLVSITIWGFAIVLIGIYWFISGRTLRRGAVQLQSINQLLSEFEDHHHANS